MPENKAEEIIKALRCSGSPGGPESCDGCPYVFLERLPKDVRGAFGREYLESCDTDRIVLEAADLLESLLAENEALKTKLWPEYCQDMAEYSCPRVLQLRQENEHLREVAKMAGKDINVPTKWVSVRDRFPMEGEMVLAFSQQDGTNIAKYVGFGGFLVQCADIWRHPARVTHWMELPGTAEVWL